MNERINGVKGERTERPRDYYFLLTNISLEILSLLIHIMKE